jgi:hypothetical protein
LSADANKDMTYGEFVQRRASIQAELREAQKVWATVTDYRYTVLSSDGARIAMCAVKTAEEKLRQLIATWQDIQRTKRSEP